MSLKWSGVGTERAEDIIKRVVSQARILRMDSETMSARDAYVKALTAFAEGEYDILLGTQMIAKGLDFPRVTLVGVLSADAALYLPDFRAPERTFQLITQVIGRAGRAERHGLAIVQTVQPDAPAIQYAIRQDYLAMAKHELKDRCNNLYPPYSRLLRVIFRGHDEQDTKKAAAELAVFLKEHSKTSATILGPAPCPLARLNTEYRFHFIVKANDVQTLMNISSLAAKYTHNHKIRVAIDVDPLSLL